MGTTARDLEGSLALVPDAALAVDQRGRIVAANAVAERLFAVAPGRLVGLTIEDLLPQQWRERHAALRAAFQDHPSTRPMGAGMSFPAARADGTVFQAEISLTPIASDARLVVAAVRDVTERLRMEARLRERLVLEGLLARVAADLVGRSGEALEASITEGLRRVCGAVGADQALLYVDDRTGEPRLRHEWGVAGVAPRQGPLDLLPCSALQLYAPPTDTSACHFIRAADIGEDEYIERDALEAAGIRACAALPLGSPGQHRGVLVLLWYTGEAEWSADTAPLLQVLGETFLGALLRQAIEEERRAEDRLHRTVLASLAEAIVVLDDDGWVVDHNAAAAHLLGPPTPSEPLLLPPRSWHVIDADGGDVAKDDLPWEQVLESGTPQTDVVIGVAADDRPTVWLSVNALPLEEERDIGRVVVSLVDVTARRQFEAALSHMALHDPMTGLANRVLLHDRIEQALAAARRDDSHVGLLFCDLDHFKDVNDSLGHEMGDEVLRAAAERISACVRPGDTVARVGGDEFVVLAPAIDDAAGAVEIARRITAATSTPLELQDHPLVTTSIGVATARPAADLALGAEALIRQADRAMYQAKAAGRARYSVADRRVAWDQGHSREEALRLALAQDRFVVVFQPIVTLPDRRIFGAEALLRLRDNGDALLEPAQFIAQLEVGDLAARVGRVVLRRACRAVARWRAVLPEMVVGINLSLRQLLSPDLVEVVGEELRRAELGPEALVVEVTESSVIAGGALDRVTSLRASGLRVGLDDFGTGYASLSHLRSLPIDFLKIDRDFVAELISDTRDQAIVEAVLALGRELKLGVVVEGIETQEQEELLIALGARFGQGFRYGRPTSAAAIHRLLEVQGGQAPGGATAAEGTGPPPGRTLSA